LRQRNDIGETYCDHEKAGKVSRKSLQGIENWAGSIFPGYLSVKLPVERHTGFPYLNGWRPRNGFIVM
jgi:hypothetical protein